MGISMTVHSRGRHRAAGAAVALAVLVGALAGGGVSASAAVRASVAPGLTAVPGIGITEIVSADAGGSPGAGASHQNSVSGDGRFVAFTSTSALTAASSGAASQVFVKDVSTGAVRLVSSGGDTDGPADADASMPSISADGRYVAFVSKATNLEPIHAAGAVTQIFVRDLQPGGRTHLISESAVVADGGDQESLLPSIAGDGRSVVFESRATDLIPGTTATRRQIYRADLTVSGIPALSAVSLQDAGAFPLPALADSDAVGPSSSYDGTVVAFVSTASNLTTDTVPTGIPQVFSHDLRDGSTRLVSAAAGAAAGADRSSFAPAVSGDGDHVAFASFASNLTPSDPGTSPTRSQVFVGTTGAAEPPKPVELVSRDRAGTRGGNASSGAPTISEHAEVIAFVSDASDLTGATSPGSSRQVVVRDLLAARSTTASVQASDPLVAGSKEALHPHLSADGRFVAFATASTGITGTATADRSAVYLRGIERVVVPPVSAIERIGGADRYEVSAAVSRTFGYGVPVVYVASGAVYPDALSGSAPAGLAGGPVLLVRKDEVPGVIATELLRLRPQRIVVLGGTATISDAVERALAAFVADPARVTRIDGADRYVVSARVSRAAFPAGAPVAYVASGQVFPDALSGSAAAGRGGGPVLLTTRDRVPDSVLAELARLRPAAIVVLGGTASVADSVMAELRRVQPASTRIAGADRYEVSAGVASSSFRATGGTVFVASGQVFPDALSGSAAAIRSQAPVLLVTSAGVPPDVATELARVKPTRIVVMGGEATVPPAVFETLRGYLAP